LYFTFAIFLLINAQDHQFIVSHPPLPESGPLPADLASSASEVPEADESQDEDDVEESESETSSSTPLPPALAEEAVIDKKRKRVDDAPSSSTPVAGEAPAEDLEYFDMLAS
jgi:hypothetical protein